MNDLIKFYKEQFNKNIVNTLIGINIIVFLIQCLTPESYQAWFVIPTQPSNFITQPWSILSGMFMHNGLMHILFNMFWLWQMGDILLKKIGSKKLLNLYMYGGVLSTIGVFIYSYMVGLNTYMLGASGAIMVIIFAAIYTVPNQKVSLFGIITIKMKHIAWVLFIMNIYGLGGSNAGGEVAHISGSVIGYIWIKSYLNKNFLKDMISF